MYDWFKISFREDTCMFVFTLLILSTTSTVWWQSLTAKSRDHTITVTEAYHSHLTTFFSIFLHIYFPFIYMYSNCDIQMRHTTDEKWDLPMMSRTQSVQEYGWLDHLQLCPSFISKPCPCWVTQKHIYSEILFINTNKWQMCGKGDNLW